jgi:hypothetical protein
MKLNVLSAKNVLSVSLLAGFVLLGGSTASANEYSRDYSAHPLRILAYPAHVAGIILEYAIARPIHALVSQDNIDVLVGHQASVSDEASHFEWAHGDGTKSIADERALLRGANTYESQPEEVAVEVETYTFQSAPVEEVTEEPVALNAEEVEEVLTEEVPAEPLATTEEPEAPAELPTSEEVNSDAATKPAPVVPLN